MDLTNGNGAVLNTENLNTNNTLNTNQETESEGNDTENEGQETPENPETEETLDQKEVERLEAEAEARDNTWNKSNWWQGVDPVPNQATIQEMNRRPFHPAGLRFILALGNAKVAGNYPIKTRKVRGGGTSSNPDYSSQTLSQWCYENGVEIPSEMVLGQIARQFAPKKSAEWAKAVAKARREGYGPNEFIRDFLGLKS